MAAFFTLATYVAAVVASILPLASLIGVLACLYFAVVYLFRAGQRFKRQGPFDAAALLVASALLVLGATSCFVFTGHAVALAGEVWP